MRFARAPKASSASWTGCGRRDAVTHAGAVEKLADEAAQHRELPGQLQEAEQRAEMALAAARQEADCRCGHDADIATLRNLDTSATTQSKLEEAASALSRAGNRARPGEKSGRRRRTRARAGGGGSRRGREGPRHASRAGGRWTRFARASSRSRGGRRFKSNGAWLAASTRLPSKSMMTWSRIISERARPAPRPRHRRGGGKTTAPPRRRRWRARLQWRRRFLSPEASCSSSRPWQATPWARRGRPTAWLAPRS